MTRFSNLIEVTRGMTPWPCHTQNRASLPLGLSLEVIQKLRPSLQAPIGTAKDGLTEPSGVRSAAFHSETLFPAMVRDQYALAIERGGSRAIQPVAGQRSEDYPGRCANHRYRVRAKVGHPDVRAVENRKTSGGTHSHGLDDGAV